MSANNPLAQVISDFRFGFQKNREAYYFIRQHRLWEGFWKFGWVMRLLIFIGLVAGLKMFQIFRDWFSGAEMDNPLALTQSVGLLFADVAHKGYDFLFMSGFKYIVLILMEIIVFHFARRTLEIKTGIRQDFTPKHFIAAEIRMIKVVAVVFMLETMFIALMKVGLGITGLKFLQTPLSLLIEAFFLGFAMLDNYNELFGFRIRPSLTMCTHYPGLVLAVGLTTYVLLLVPVIGAIVAPFLVSVSATLAMHDLRVAEGQWRVELVKVQVKEQAEGQNQVQDQ